MAKRTRRREQKSEVATTSSSVEITDASPCSSSPPSTSTTEVAQNAADSRKTPQNTTNGDYEDDGDEQEIDVGGVQDNEIVVAGAAADQPLNLSMKSSLANDQPSPNADDVPSGVDAASLQQAALQQLFANAAAAAAGPTRPLRVDVDEHAAEQRSKQAESANAAAASNLAVLLKLISGGNNRQPTPPQPPPPVNLPQSALSPQEFLLRVLANGAGEQSQKSAAPSKGTASSINGLDQFVRRTLPHKPTGLQNNAAISGSETQQQAFDSNTLEKFRALLSSTSTSTQSARPSISQHLDMEEKAPFSLSDTILTGNFQRHLQGTKLATGSYFCADCPFNSFDMTALSIHMISTGHKFNNGGSSSQQCPPNGANPARGHNQKASVQRKTTTPPAPRVKTEPNASVPTQQEQQQLSPSDRLALTKEISEKLEAIGASYLLPLVQESIQKLPRLSHPASNVAESTQSASATTSTASASKSSSSKVAGSNLYSSVTLTPCYYDDDEVKKINTCLICGAAFSCLPELTVHMMQTKHFKAMPLIPYHPQQQSWTVKPDGSGAANKAEQCPDIRPAMASAASNALSTSSGNLALASLSIPDLLSRAAALLRPQQGGSDLSRAGKESASSPTNATGKTLSASAVDIVRSLAGMTGTPASAASMLTSTANVSSDRSRVEKSQQEFDALRRISSISIRQRVPWTLKVSQQRFGPWVLRNKPLSFFDAEVSPPTSETRKRRHAETNSGEEAGPRKSSRKASPYLDSDNSSSSNPLSSLAKLIDDKAKDNKVSSSPSTSTASSSAPGYSQSKRSGSALPSQTLQPLKELQKLLSTSSTTSEVVPPASSTTTPKVPTDFKLKSTSLELKT